jgi:long-chain fatty acid transport protein
MNKHLTTFVGIALALPVLPALATNGYFAHGYGLKAKGMGGVATALAQDSFGGANNPASMIWAGSRTDIGLDWFRPQRSAERTGAGFATLNGKVESDSKNFYIPELGYNRMVGEQLSVGLSIYGNGGLNTDYAEGGFNCGGGSANALCGSGRLGVDLIQLVVAPTVSYKLAPRQSVGAALLIGYQRFKASGLQAFDNAPGFPPFTSDPGWVTNNGSDRAHGLGLRVGWQAQVSDAVTVGVAYSSKINMSKFDKYKGLFAGHGDFDIPANYSLGVAWAPSADWTLAADYGRIAYSRVAAVGNSSSAQAPLGADNGPGFGWRDVSVLKLGAAFKWGDALTLRAGWNHGSNPVQASDVTFNILAPGVVQDHFTLGFTAGTGKDSEVSGALMIAPRKSTTGSSLFNAVLGAGAAGTETVSMRQTSFGLAWAQRF